MDIPSSDMMKIMTFAKLTPEEIRKHKGVSFTGITTNFFCHDGKGHLLMAKRSQNTRDEQGTWEPGGGGLKHGQTIEDNLKREIWEEYAVKPKKIDFLGYYDAFRTSPDGLPTHWLAMCFVALADRSKVKINEPDMIDEIDWFTLDKLPSPLHSQWHVFMKKLGDKLKESMRPRT